MPESDFRTRRMAPVRRGALALLAAFGLAASVRAQEPAAPGPSKERETVARFVALYCVECHNADDRTIDLALDELSQAPVDRNPKAWEKVVRRLEARQMPPADAMVVAWPTSPPERDTERAGRPWLCR